MNIKQAKNLKVGDYVNCPPDRGDIGFLGIVSHLTYTENNINGTLYIWVSVKNIDRFPHIESVWPSNRISKA